MTPDMFHQLARYNRWANAWLYQAALALPDADYRRPTGVFFGSLHRTLNHILVADRVWLKRLTGEGEAPAKLDAVLYDDPNELARARVAEDERLIATVDLYDADRLDERIAYRTLNGTPHEQILAEILMHMFNHQTHHRGQAHACLSVLGAAPPSLDLMLFQRGLPAPTCPSN